ncbi:hypothetical protein A0H81_09837 [Grifola frondosa]|uniref:Uncharacterized protein n=1 Tax=Grifola frondosa TaxID=5627 RepID=A0A1C7LZM6_GRIFR|nr:hypothetical protein A0H81_09837 [Grifola frondosa]
MEHSRTARDDIKPDINIDLCIGGKADGPVVRHVKFSSKKSERWRHAQMKNYRFGRAVGSINDVAFVLRQICLP